MFLQRLELIVLPELNEAQSRAAYDDLNGNSVIIAGMTPLLLCARERPEPRHKSCGTAAYH
jgi:hypothetical protein